MFLMRNAALTLAITSVLIFTSYAVGLMSDAIIWINKVEVDQFIYLLSIEDRERSLRLMFAGTRCFPNPPRWIEPHMAPVPDYAKFFVERETDSLKKVPRCRPRKTHPNAEPKPVSPD